MRRLVVIGLVLFGVLAACPAESSADEQAYEFQYPSQAVPLDFPLLSGALAVAQDYWEVRGIHPPPLVGVYELPHEDPWEEDAASSELPGGRVWISGSVLEELHTTPLFTRAELCYLMIHERGHNAGLHHSDAGIFPIMAIPAEVPPPWREKAVAPHCWAWAQHPFASGA